MVYTIHIYIAACNIGSWKSQRRVHLKMQMDMNELVVRSKRTTAKEKLVQMSKIAGNGPSREREPQRFYPE